MDIIEAFLGYKQGKNCSARTIQLYGQHLRRLKTWLNGNILECTFNQLVEYSGVYLHKQKVLARSRRAHISAIREFFKWALLTDLIRSNPAVELTPPRATEKLPIAMSPNHLELLLQQPNIDTFLGLRDYVIIMLMAGCGLRVGEVVKLNQEHLLFSHFNGNETLSIQVNGKGSRERIVPAPPEVWVMMRAYLGALEEQNIDRLTDKGERILFVSTKNRQIPLHEYYGEHRRLSTWSIFNCLKQYGRRARIPESALHPHALRHGFGVMIANKDIDGFKSMALMGHTTEKAHKIYCRISPEKLRQTMEKLQPFQHIKTHATDLMRYYNRKNRA